MDYLPIGSIVTLHDVKEKMMIFGRRQTSTDGKAYDYCACLYPIGFIDPTKLYLFQRGDIETVVFTGFENDAELELRETLDE